MIANQFLCLDKLYAQPETAAIREAMRHWMQGALSWVDATLDQNPPAWPEPAGRRQALFMLDEPMHVLSAPVEPPIAAFLERRIEKAVAAIEQNRQQTGATIWKLYDHGFVIRTPLLTVGIDLHQGPYGSFSIADRLFERLLRLVDVLFVTHRHEDHADPAAIAGMLNLRRPVIVPPGVAPTVSETVLAPQRDPAVEHELEVRGETVSFRVFPGHQGEVPNNVYLLRLRGGVHVLHTGDQTEAADFLLWIDGFGQRFTVDVMLANCWWAGLPRFIEQVSPRLVITGHENELAHGTDRRYSYSRTYAQLENQPTPVIVMAWGEGLHYDPADPPAPVRGGLAASDLPARPMWASSLE